MSKENPVYKGNFIIILKGVPFMNEVKKTSAEITDDDKTVTVQEGEIHTFETHFKFMVDGKEFSWGHKFIEKIYGTHPNVLWDPIVRVNYLSN
jgi:hypothetical protein